MVHSPGPQYYKFDSLQINHSQAEDEAEMEAAKAMNLSEVCP